ncbi:uncharacterized protein LAESUDRAFT_195278 [Laetiporus sulphureus 93-53]|uniref:Uncharacterized protein n=1 Tax=Laetiporus sulphureus 93-53 TaxID=1314785 RepID=A0A165E153_9APHY|nr:uncharacterized protein LAESUDRAFT_195278 [Laetiporus sulphureus 93-53]KZT06048.1 hypothetical protein LAESUDRAFT_195278 [Laetiporus sulphureus 93-53]
MRVCVHLHRAKDRAPDDAPPVASVPDECNTVLSAPLTPNLPTRRATHASRVARRGRHAYKTFIRIAKSRVTLLSTPLTHPPLSARHRAQSIGIARYEHRSFGLPFRCRAPWGSPASRSQGLFSLLSSIKLLQGLDRIQSSLVVDIAPSRFLCLGHTVPFRHNIFELYLPVDCPRLFLCSRIVRVGRSPYDAVLDHDIVSHRSWPTVARASELAVCNDRRLNEGSDS